MVVTLKTSWKVACHELLLLVRLNNWFHVNIFDLIILQFVMFDFVWLFALNLTVGTMKSSLLCYTGLMCQEVT